MPTLNAKSQSHGGMLPKRYLIPESNHHCCALTIARHKTPARKHPVQHRAIKENEPVDLWVGEPAILREGRGAKHLVGNQCRATGTFRKIEHRGHQRVPSTTSPLVVRVKVQLVARSMRSAVCPNLRDGKGRRRGAR